MCVAVPFYLFIIFQTRLCVHHFFPPLLLFVGYHNNFSLNIYMLICASSLSAHPRYLFILFYLIFFSFLIYLVWLFLPSWKSTLFFCHIFLCCLIIEIRLQSMSRYFVVFFFVFFLADSSGKQTNRLTESAKIEFYFLFFEEIFLLLFGARLLLLLTGFRVSRISKLSEILISPHWIFFF